MRRRTGSPSRHAAAEPPEAVDVAQWRQLAAAAVQPNPFFEPEALLPAVRRLDGAGVRLLTARDAGGTLIGLLPVRRARSWRRLPALAHGSWMHPYCFFGAPLVAAGEERPALAALLGALRHGAGFAPLEALPADGPVAGALDAVLAGSGAPPVVFGEHERASLERRPDGGYLDASLSSKARRELRRQRRLLEEHLGHELVTTDEAGDGAAVEAFLALEAAGWKGRSGTAMASAGAAGFFRELCAGFAAAGRLQLLMLRAGDHLLAAKCNLLAGPGVFCFKIAFDEHLANRSPGVQLEVDNVHAFHAREELAWMDSCADPDNQMINRLWPDRRRIRTLLVPGAGLVGRAGRAQATTATAVRRRLKERQS